MTTLAQDHDCLLLDLDGTVLRGQEATTGAVETLATVEARTLYVTNNASRAPDEVAQHLIELGFTAAAADVVTSGQSAARLLAAQEESSLSTWFAQQLEKMLRERSGYEGARQRALARLKKGMKLGWQPPSTRGEVHER